MVPVFNISSCGASATVWLTALLNSHPKVFCIHAMRECPFTGEEVSAAQVIEGLNFLWSRTEQKRSIGLIHSYYDADTYTQFREAGGGFMAIVRHPVFRIHSLFTHHFRYVQQNTIRHGDVYRTIEEDGRVEELCGMFSKRAEETLYSDLSNMSMLQPDEIALFERLVSDASHCRARLEKLLDLDLQDFEATIEASLDRKLNQHTDEHVSAAETFKRWPLPYRDAFQAFATRIGIVGVRDMYRRFGYDIADMLVG